MEFRILLPVLAAYCLCGVVVCRERNAANSAWKSDADLAEERNRANALSNVMLVLYCKTKSQQNRPENRLLSVADVAKTRLQNNNINIVKVDCTTSTEAYCNGTDDQYPRLILYRSHGEDIEMLYKNTPRANTVVAMALHYYLLDLPEGTKSNMGDMPATRHPIRLITSEEEHKALSQAQNNAVVYYIRNPFEDEHKLALEMVYFHGFVLPFYFVHDCNHLTQYKEKCTENTALLLVHHYYPSLNQAGVDLFLERFDLSYMQTFLFIHALPPITPSDSVLDIYTTLEDSNLLDIHLTFIVTTKMDFAQRYTQFVMAASQYRGLFAISHVDIEDEQVTAAISEVKNYVANNKSPVVITRRSEKHRKEFGGMAAQIQPLDDNHPLEEHLQQIVLMENQDTGGGEEFESSGRATKRNEIQQVSTEEWNDFMYSAKVQKQHVFTVQCDESCPRTLMAAVFRMHRSISEDRVAERKVRLVFSEQDARTYPQFQHHWFGRRNPVSYSGDWEFDSMMEFMDQHTGLQIVRSDEDDTDVVYDDTDEPPLDQDDDEIAMTAFSNFERRGHGLKTTVHELSRSDFEDSKFATGKATVIVVHYANFFSPISKAFVFPYQNVADKMAGLDWVQFHWVDCLNLHDICDQYHIRKFPSVAFFSFPSSAQFYKGPLDADAIAAAIHQFANRRVMPLQSIDDYSALTGNTAPSGWGRPLAKTTLVIATANALGDDGIQVLNSVAGNTSTITITAHATGDVAKGIAGDEPLPMAILIKHQDFLQPQIRRSLGEGNPLDGSALTALVKQSSTPLIGELSAMTYTAYRKSSQRIAILFITTKLDTAAKWQPASNLNGNQGDMPLDLNTVFPPALRNAALKYSSGEMNIPANAGKEGVSPLAFTWIYGLSSLAASVLEVYVQPPHMPTLLILDYETDEMFLFKQDPESATEAKMDVWVEDYLNNKLTASASLYPGNWAPLKKGFDFVSRAMEKVDAVGTNPEEERPNEKRSRIPSRLARRDDDVAIAHSQHGRDTIPDVGGASDDIVVEGGAGARPEGEDDGEDEGGELSKDEVTDVLDGEDPDARDEERDQAIWDNLEAADKEPLEEEVRKRAEASLGIDPDTGSGDGSGDGDGAERDTQTESESKSTAGRDEL